MDRDPVSSTSLASVGYDPASQTLEVEFANGSVYQYYNVDEGLYERFKLAPSKGEFLNTYVKPSYPYSRVA